MIATIFAISVILFFVFFALDKHHDNEELFSISVCEKVRNIIGWTVIGIYGLILFCLFLLTFGSMLLDEEVLAFLKWVLYFG